MTITSPKGISHRLVGLLLMALVSPVWALTPIEVAKLIASDGEREDYFGVSVAVDGDTVLIGAFSDDEPGSSRGSGDSGSAYIFTRNAGVWTEHAKLTASDAASNDNFGVAVALDGDTVLIGSQSSNENGLVGNGSAYIFTRNAGVWTEQTKLTASDAASNDNFGSAVALDGDTALISASESVYVFARSNGVWTEQAKLTANDDVVAMHFGASVSVDGDTILIGASGDDDNGWQSGSAYVFVRGSGVWTEQTKLTASDTVIGDRFGAAVAVDEDTILIGGSGPGVNSAYVFTRSNGVWTEQAKLTASDAGGYDDFGSSVALEGDIAVIGDSHNYGINSAYVFTRSNGVWTEQAKLTIGEAAIRDNFGRSVSVKGDTALIGAYLDLGNGLKSGAVYVYSLISETLVDIKPGKEPNLVNLESTELIPVAILTAGEFDALQVDPATTKFGPGKAVAERYDVVDVDHDGDEDLLLYFRVQQTGIACSDVQTTLIGKLYDGSNMVGSDAIENVGCQPSKLFVIEAESMTLFRGIYTIEANAAASGGQLIRGRTGGYPASARTDYAGPEGTYDIYVSYFDERDGRSSLAFALNGKILDQWVADEDPLCRECASPGASTLRTRVVARGVLLLPGDDIALRGIGDHYEYARFDKITFSRTGFRVFEAEKMNLSAGYSVEENAAASNGQLIRGQANGGYHATASIAYYDAARVYDIEVSYFDENDGASTLAFLVNGQILDQWIADEDPLCRECASPGASTLRKRVVARGMRLLPGDVIALQGTGERYEYARFDKITLNLPAGLETLEAEDMSLEGGFLVEDNAAASNGLLIRGNSADAFAPGQASAVFMGSKDTYDITVTYFDEYDGISSMAVFLNGQLLAQWLADENPACRDCASPNERTLRSRVVAAGIEIAPGDDIRLESTVNHYEYGRFDKIDFTPSLSP